MLKSRQNSAIRKTTYLLCVSSIRKMRRTVLKNCDGNDRRDFRLLVHARYPSASAISKVHTSSRTKSPIARWWSRTATGAELELPSDNQGQWTRQERQVILTLLKVEIDLKPRFSTFYLGIHFAQIIIDVFFVLISRYHIPPFKGRKSIKLLSSQAEYWTVEPVCIPPFSSNMECSRRLLIWLLTWDKIGRTPVSLIETSTTMECFHHFISKVIELSPEVACFQEVTSMSRTSLF